MCVTPEPQLLQVSFVYTWFTPLSGLVCSKMSHFLLFSDCSGFVWDYMLALTRAQPLVYFGCPAFVASDLQCNSQGNVPVHVSET